MPLKFEYCECGCRGHQATIAETGDAYSYWIYNDLKGNFTLYRGHGISTHRLLCERKTMKACCAFAQRDFRKKLPVLLKALRDAAGEDDFSCCGGSDENPPQHTQDCPAFF